MDSFKCLPDIEIVHVFHSYYSDIQNAEPLIKIKQKMQSDETIHTYSQTKEKKIHFFIRFKIKNYKKKHLLVLDKRFKIGKFTKMLK